MAANKENLLEKWLVESDPLKRELVFKELTLHGLFPDNTNFEKSFGLYPSVEDENFLVKLFHKREFAENKYDKYDLSGIEDLADLSTCKGSVEFELSPIQRFVSTYLSGKTPYLSALLYHGVGVGKTCAAISITESFLHFNPKKKAFIIAPPNIQPNFIRTIFDINNVTISENNLPNTHRGCTGNLYLELTATEYERDKKVIERKVNQLIKNRYDFMGYIQLGNYIERECAKIPKHYEDTQINPKDKTDKCTFDIQTPPNTKRDLKTIKLIREMFSGHCMIIDEAHNLRDIQSEKPEENLDAPGGITELTDIQEGKRLTPSLQRVLNYAIDMKLVLLTATPMYNDYKEIIFLLNLLLANDKRAQLKPQDVFDTNGDFIPTGLNKFKNAVSAYVSYMRGETPISFPIRLNPYKLEKLQWPTIGLNNAPIILNENIKRGLENLPIVPVKYGDETYSIYENIVKSNIETYGLGINGIDTIVQSGNWIYPGEDDEQNIETRIRDTGFDNAFNDNMGSRNFTRFGSKLGPPTWLFDTNLVNYSPKSAFIIKKLRNTKGPAFVYSRFIKSGALPFALALEANGYTLYGRSLPLLNDDTFFKSVSRQCALCKERENTHKLKDAQHKFVPAKYVLLTGRKDISPNNNDAVIAERASTNYNGADIKVVIGSQVASEGIDLKFIREIYVMDSWYHLNKMEQVLGRGIRTCSHIHPNITKEERNCTVYLLVNKLSGKESADLYMYREGMRKSLQMGKVTRRIKEYALDCNLNINVNVIQGLGKKNQTDAQGNTYEVNIDDQNYTNMCDWTECAYACSTSLDLDKYKTKNSNKDFLKDTNTLTYDNYDARLRESEIKKAIKNLFESGEMFLKSEDLTELLSNIPVEALYSILHDIVNNKSFRLIVNKKEGYLTYKNGFYLFQPLELESTDIPLSIRIANYPIKQDEFIPIKVKTKPEEVVAEPVAIEENKNFIKTFWGTITSMAEKIRNGTLENRLQNSVIDVLKKKYSNTVMFNMYTQSVESIIWLYTPIQNEKEFRIVLAEIFLEYVWDNLLTIKEQLLLVKNVDDIISAVANEQIIQNGKYFRYLNSTNAPYDIQYYCGDKICDISVKDVLDEKNKNDKRDPYNKLPPANSDNVGEYYGFMIAKKNEIIFKTNKPAAVGSKPKGGSQCKNITATKGHYTDLIKFGRIIRETYGINRPDFDLNEGALTGKRQLKGANAYCSIKEYVLRWMDKRNIRNKRWFYRPISSFKTGHK